jgi:hypothetical protein
MIIAMNKMNFQNNSVKYCPAVDRLDRVVANYPSFLAEKSLNQTQVAVFCGIKRSQPVLSV